MTKRISSIAIAGEETLAWFAAAQLCARFNTPQVSVSVAAQAAPVAERSMMLRPSVKTAHGLIGISDQELYAKAAASPALASTWELPDERVVRLPFTPYGVSRSGAGFLHYWKRAHDAGQASPIENYNPAFVPLGSDISPATLDAELQARRLSFGYQVNASRYGSLLKAKALQAGATDLGELISINPDKDGTGTASNVASSRHVVSDILFDLTAKKEIGSRPPKTLHGWNGNRLALPMTQSGPALGMYAVQSCVAQLLELLPDQTLRAIETREHDRLMRATSERLDDMVCLLCGNEQDWAARQVLQMKIDVFKHRGRILREDYDMFADSEWIAAMFARGHFPQTYDRLVDRFDLSEVIAWVQRYKLTPDHSILSVDA